MRPRIVTESSWIQGRHCAIVGGDRKRVQMTLYHASEKVDITLVQEGVFQMCSRISRKLGSSIDHEHFHPPFYELSRKGGSKWTTAYDQYICRENCRTIWLITSLLLVGIFHFQY